MASVVKLSKDKKPLLAIDFVALDGRRGRIRLGRVSKSDANDFKDKLQRIIEAKKLNHSLSDSLIEWIGNLDSKIRNRLAKFRLCNLSQTNQLFSVLEDYVSRRSKELKKSSINRINDTVKVLKEFFSLNPNIEQITPAMAMDWRLWLLEQGKTEATARTHSRNIKTIFRDAIERELTKKNPFKKLPSTSVAAEKGRYITPEETKRLIDAAPNWKWRLLIGLIRYGGLRCISETHSVTWHDVDWDRNRLTVKAPKTGKTRVIPIRPELRELLDDAYFMEGSAEKLIDLPTNNRHRRLRSIIKKASVEPWEDIFQHLRRCCRTQLLNEGNAPHAVSRWMGHGQQVGDEHYTILTDDQFDKVTQKSAAKSAAENSGNARQTAENEKTVTVEFGRNAEKTKKKRMRALGLEPRTYGLKVLQSVAENLVNNGTKCDGENDAQQKAQQISLHPDDIEGLAELLCESFKPETVTRLLAELRYQNRQAGLTGSAESEKIQVLES